jgi:hypothetical protein
MKPEPALWINFPASRLPGKISSGGERTRTADFHVANVFTADFGGLRRTITAGQRVIHTLANVGERRRPRDGRGMSGIEYAVISLASASPS